MDQERHGYGRVPFQVSLGRLDALLRVVTQDCSASAGAFSFHRHWHSRLHFLPLSIPYLPAFFDCFASSRFSSLLSTHTSDLSRHHAVQRT